MVARAFATWWSNMRPYYTKAYQEVWVGFAITAYAFYKVSYGGKKAVKGKSGH